MDALGATTEMERQVVVDSVADFDNDPEVTLHFVENNTISKFYLIEGKELDINDEVGVWLVELPRRVDDGDSQTKKIYFLEIFTAPSSRRFLILC